MTGSKSQKEEKPSTWLPQHFYIPEPRDPYTGAYSGEPGPIILHEIQQRILDEAVRKDKDGMFVYSTIIYSTIKKSGKSTGASGLCLYLADQIPYSHSFCLANDGKQADDRLMGPIAECIRLHNKLGGKFKGIRAYTASVSLPNSATIESLPCDAAGNAGSEPTATYWSELWGFETPVKRKLFTEMTIPSTKFGRAIRFIETYAGYSGTSLLLWDLYQQAVKNGDPHPDFRDLSSGGEPVVWTNEGAGIFCYWDHEPRMAWQLGAAGAKYYQNEARVLEDAEYKRLHRNLWVSESGSFLPEPEVWDMCGDPNLPVLARGDRTPAIVAMDAAETNDCAAIVLVTRHPERPTTDIAIRKCRIFKPGGATGTILLEQTLGKTLLEWGLYYNITVVCYDAYQLAKLTQDYSRGSLTFTVEELMEMFEEFGENISSFEQALVRYKRAIQLWYYRYSQQTERTIADKFLFDLIIPHRVAWNPNDQNEDIAPRGDQETLTKHIKQAGAGGAKGQYRLVKLSDDLKIDGAVALGMAAEMCLRLNVESTAMSNTEMLERVQRGQMSYEEYLKTITSRIGM